VADYTLADSPYQRVLVVLGAGASFDNGRPPSQWNLPLARTLFTQPEFMEAARSYSEMAGLLADLRAASEGDGPGIEQRLDDLQQEADSIYPQAKVELMAVRYYLRHVTWVCSQEVITSTSHGTTTARLFRKLNRWRTSGPGRSVSVVSFNYDTLLEDAASSVISREFNSLSDYLDEARAWQFFKLHGSANWAQVIEDGLGGDMYPSVRKVIRQAESLKLSTSDFRMWEQSPSVKNSHMAEHPSSAAEQIAVAPALALPLINKATFVCPQEHVTEFQASGRAFDALVVVGWRAGEPHFLRELQPGRRVPTMVIGGKDAEHVMTALRELQISGQGIIEPNGFSHVMSGQDLESFLSAPSTIWPGGV
jgi:hypothetical protein